MKKILISLSSIIIVISLFLIVNANFQTNRNVLRTINNGADLTKKPEDENKLNILLLGYWNENWDWIWFNTDSFIVVSIDLDKNEITFNPLPLYTDHRTLETLIDNAKIAAFTNYWFYIDHYATVNFAAFKEAIDMLWWIDIYVDEAINDTQFPNDVSFSNGKIQLNRDPSRWYDPFNISTWRQHLDWETTLKYVRSKKTTSEEDRQHRQQKVLNAIKDKILVSWIDISKLYNLYKIYDKEIITDITLNDATWIVWKFKEFKVVLENNTNSTLWWKQTINTDQYNNIQQNKKESYTQEQKNAFEFAYKNWITNANSIEKAKMNSPLTRIQMAKMLSYFAINVLWKKPDLNKNAYFVDVTDKLNNEYDNAVTLAYQLWIMWVNTKWNRFWPKDVVTRAEFATALSRMLYNIENWTWKEKYYRPHIVKLYQEWIISKTDPKLIEKRWYVMVMLMKSVE